MADPTPPLVRMEALRTHTLFGAGHEQPHHAGDIYTVEEQFVDTLIWQGMARRAAPEPADPPARHAYQTTEARTPQKAVLEKPKK